MSKELLAGSRFSFSFLSIPNSQIFAFPCSMSLYKQGGGGVENGLSSPSPSVPCITVELFKRKDIITEEIKNSCAGPALLLSRVPRYSLLHLVLIQRWLYPRKSLLAAVGFWSTADVHTPSLQQAGADFGTARLMRDGDPTAQSSSGLTFLFIPGFSIMALEVLLQFCCCKIQS